MPCRWTDEQLSGLTFRPTGFVVADEPCAEVDDDLHAAVGQDALCTRVAGSLRAQGPVAPDAPPEHRSRNQLSVQHVVGTENAGQPSRLVGGPAVETITGLRSS